MKEYHTYKTVKYSLYSDIDVENLKEYIIENAYAITLLSKNRTLSELYSYVIAAYKNNASYEYVGGEDLFISNKKKGKFHYKVVVYYDKNNIDKVIRNLTKKEKVKNNKEKAVILRVLKNVKYIPEMKRLGIPLEDVETFREGKKFNIM